MSHASKPGIIKTWLNCDNLPLFQNHLLQTRIIMDFQSEPVAGAVEKTDVLAFAHLSWKSAPLEKGLDRLVDRHSINPGFDPLQSQRLTIFYRLPKFPLRVAGPSSQDRSSDVAEVSGGRVAWKDVENNEGIGEQRT